MSAAHKRFVAIVWDFYATQGRHDLPWRQTSDPYHVLVSELMLQQTQVARVIPKYNAFITAYPTIQKLAAASLGDVLRLWQGLGYNRRAKYLLQCAQDIHQQHNDIFPSTFDELLSLPGIGPYTAGAICAFAYNQPVELIETNVRQVYIHHFFSSKPEVTDQDILIKLRKTLPTNDACKWYAALMDYGTYLKSQYGNNTQKLKGYTKQKPFKGSDREIRGAILRTLASGGKSVAGLSATIDTFQTSRVQKQIKVLKKEGLIVERSQVLQLP